MNDGTMIAAEIDDLSGAGAYSQYQEHRCSRPTRSSISPSVHKHPNYRAKATNPNAVTSQYRAVGHPIGSVGEYMMDWAADVTGLDLFEIRRKNVMEDDSYRAISVPASRLKTYRTGCLKLHGLMEYDKLQPNRRIVKTGYRDRCRRLHHGRPQPGRLRRWRRTDRRSGRHHRKAGTVWRRYRRAGRHRSGTGRRYRRGTDRGSSHRPPRSGAGISGDTDAILSGGTYIPSYCYRGRPPTRRRSTCVAKSCTWREFCYRPTRRTSISWTAMLWTMDRPMREYRFPK